MDKQQDLTVDTRSLLQYPVRQTAVGKNTKRMSVCNRVALLTAEINRTL